MKVISETFKVLNYLRGAAAGVILVDPMNQRT